MGQSKPLSNIHTQASSHGEHCEAIKDMTETQLLMWTPQKLEPDNTLYNVGYAHTIYGNIDRGAFGEAIQTLISSSDVFRTVIEERQGVPYQRIRSDFPYDLPYLDLSDTVDPESTFRNWSCERLRETQFDLTECLFETCLIRLADDIFGWYLCMNHLVADYYTHVLAVRYAGEFYERALRGDLPSRVDVPAYQDYVALEAMMRQSEHYRQSEAYWHNRLSRRLEPVTLYGGRRQQPVASSCRISAPLGARRTRRLKELAHRGDLFVKNENVTLFNIMMALLAAYVSRVGGVNELRIGAAFLNRPANFRDTVGLFRAILPLQVAMGPDDSFIALVHQVTAEAREAVKHRQYAVRNPYQNPAFELSVNYLPPTFSHFGSLPLKAHWIPPAHAADSLAVTLHDLNHSGNLRVDFDLREDVFRDDQHDLVRAHFLQLLDSFLEDPEQPVARATLLPPSERQRLLVDFARSLEAPVGVETVVELFEAQVAAQPHHPAVVFEDQSLTYAELDHRANQLARYLQELGVGPETLVGLCVERAPEMMVGLLGILKAGGAYVPLDPTYPPDRVAFMLADSEAPVVLTQARLTGQLPDVDAHVISLDADWPSISGYPEMPPDTDVSDRNLAYVIYTSGSTGTPKGVQVEHRALANHIRTARDRMALGPDDRVLQFMSISFDAAAEEIYPCLASGATLVLRNDAMLASIPTFVEQLRDWGVTMVVLPTAFWHQVVIGLSPGAPEISDRLRLLIVGGERMLPERVRTWKEEVGRRVTLINAYGPTEATVVTTRFNLAELAVDDVWEEVPIGRPIPNLQVYLLDAELQLVPIGVPGELCVGGAGVARGYLNRPALTAERFVPDPFDDAPGARLYRTGDLARYLPDGNIEFLGRVDHQVKVRGFRIELGAIETVLRQHPAVRDAVVLAREDVPGDRRLVAYVVSGDEAASSSTLQSFVKDKLPAYMVPSAFVSMDAFPLTSNGKVDRRALPVPDLSRPDLDQGYAPPRSEIERQLVQIWEELLDVEPIGVRDDFFELGGHSLLAVRLTARVEEAFGVNIPLTTIFQEPTIEQLTRHVAWQQGMTIWPPLVAIQPKGSRPPFFCVHPLCGDVVSFTIWSRYLGDDQPFYGLRARGLDGVQDPITEVEAIAADYVDELRTVQPEGPYTLGGYAGGGVIAFEMAQQLQARGEELALLLIINEPPPNSRYHEFSLRPRTLLGFVRNLPPWLREFLRLRLAQLVFRGQLLLRPSGALGRLAQRVQPLGRVVDRLQGRSRRLIDEHNRALLDRDNVPRIHDIRQRRIAMLHQEALRDYTPRPYPGRVTVFRTRRQPLFCSFDPELGWGALAGAGVDVRIIPGSTASVLKDPDARALAEALRRALAEARQAQETQSQ